MLTQQDIDNIKQTLNAGIQIVAVPQLFETPAHLAERMIDEAELLPEYHDESDINDCKILEPSAGTGKLIEAILNAGAGLTWKNISIVEQDRNLCGMLSAKYKRAYPGDFLERGYWELGGKFDRIIMNPPFINGADIKHIKHALTMLADNGRLVAVCANGPRQQTQLKPLAEESGGFYEPLPAGTFKDKGTNVNTALLVIEGF